MLQESPLLSFFVIHFEKGKKLDVKWKTENEKKREGNEPQVAVVLEIVGKQRITRFKTNTLRECS